MNNELLGLMEQVESITDGYDPQCLPVDFVDDNAEEAWISILGGKKRIQELADKIRRLKIETLIPRKQLRLLPDASLLGVCYGEPSFNQQLTKLLPIQQYDSISPRSLTRRFVLDLLGTRAVELGEILALESHQKIKERICALLPEAQSMFDHGWGASTYPGLLTLAYLFEIARFTAPGTTSYYQACFALNAILLELLHTPVITLTIDRVREIPGYRAVYAGFNVVKLRMDGIGVAANKNPLPSALSVANAFDVLAGDVLDGDCCSVLRMHELMFSLSNKDHQGLRLAAEEYMGFRLAPLLNRSTARIREALHVAGISEGCSEVPSDLAAWHLNPSKTALTNAHFRVLQPLIQVENVAQFEKWDEQIDKIFGLAVAAATSRREIGELVSRSSINADLISQTAETLNGLTSKITTLTNCLISDISSVLTLCATAKADWNSLVQEMASPVVSIAHLSESASEEDKELLEMALEENHNLRGQLQDVQAQNHQLGLKAEALEHYQASSYSGPSLDPLILRKAVSSPSQLTPVEVLSYIQHVGGQHVKILPSAWRSAEESAHFELSDRMLDLLTRLVFEYAPSLADGRSDAEAKEILGTNYSAKESESVEMNPALRSERTFKVGSEDTYFCRHLLVGNDPGRVRGMRVYFDIIGGVVVIAYAGKHLTVASSN